MHRLSFPVGLHQYFHKLMSLRLDRFSVSRQQRHLLVVGRRRRDFDQAVCARKTETEMLHDKGSLLFQPSAEARGRVRACT